MAQDESRGVIARGTRHGPQLEMWARIAAETAASAVLVGGILAAHILAQRALLSPDAANALAAIVHALLFAGLAGMASARVSASPVLAIASAGPHPAAVPRLARATLAHALGACAGVVGVQAALNLDPVQQVPHHAVSVQLLALEAAATSTLTTVSLGMRRPAASVAGAAVVLAAGALTAHFATANPAATIARTLTSGPLGLSLADAGAVLIAQIAAIALAMIAVRPRA